MRLSLQTDYALRTLMYLATTRDRVKAAAIAEFFDISASHVAKVVNQLARRGFVRSIRGAGGGIELALAPENIRIGDVVEAFEGGMQLLDCVSSQEALCVIQRYCKLRNVFAEAERLQREFLHSVFLSDVIPQGRRAKSLDSWKDSPRPHTGSMNR